MVPIRGEWKPFSNLDEKLEYLRLWGLIPPKSKSLRPFMVVDGYFGAPEPCEVIGYKDKNWAVIELPDGPHAIFGEYLAEMQPDAMQKLPRGMCFTEILQDYIVLDIETTGFSRVENEIIEFAAVRYAYGKETARYQTLIQPRNPIPLSITALTGISMSDVADAPFLEDVSGDILSFIGNRPIVGHNGVSFDFPFLSAQLNIELDNPKIDTLYMARKAFPLLKTHKLEYLKTALELGDTPSHRAMNDVCITNALLWACLAPRRHESAMYKAYLDGKSAPVKKERKSKVKKAPEAEAIEEAPSAQMDLFSMPPVQPESVMDEAQVFEVLKPYLVQVLETNCVGADSIKAEMGEKFTSVSYVKPETVDEHGTPIKLRAMQLAFRISARKKKYFFSVRDSYLQYAPEHLRDTAKSERGETGYSSSAFEPPINGVQAFAEMLCKALDGTIDSVHCDYACCSRCEECSDALHCVQPIAHIAANCGYRKILKTGRVFYGKNRNVE